jgi:hypothetical protein
MKTNHYNPATHVGLQPVRVLKWNLAQTVESLSKDPVSNFVEILKRHGLRPFIGYDYTEGSIIDPSGNHRVPFVDSNKQITIHETFLSMVWAICYSHLAFFNEQISKPSLNRSHGQAHSIDAIAVRNAVNIYEYGVSLVRNYKPWDKASLPNPEEYDASDLYIEKANGLFVHAMGFIIYHELAHIDCGHLDNYISKADMSLIEAEADRRAIDLMLGGADDDHATVNYGAGMLLGFCSLLTLKRELTSVTHPHLAHRIECVLKSQTLDDTSNLWGIATMSLKLWDDLYNPKTPRISWPQNADTFKELFYNVFNQIR